jgi:hypothetical protein
MRWVTRKFVHVDRTASAWLIKRFIDKEAEFVFIEYPREEPKPEHGIPFDIPGVELGHHDGKCTFEVLVEKYGIGDPVVHEIAKIVHAADIEGEMSKAPEAQGIKAVFTGLRLVAKDDYEALEVGFKIWDSIYVYILVRKIQEEKHEALKTLDRIERINYLRNEALRKLPK